jgi:quercetin dioxygenase-like cupin family protein
MNGFALSRRALSAVIASIAAVGTSYVCAADQPAGFIQLRPDQVQWTEFPGRPGVQLAVIEGNMKEPGPFIIRIKFPANYKLAPHWHPGLEHVTVISGTLYFGIGDKLEEAGASPASTGSVIVIPPKTDHFALTREETVIQGHGIGPWETHPASEPSR